MNKVSAIREGVSFVLLFCLSCMTLCTTTTTVPAKGGGKFRFFKLFSNYKKLPKGKGKGRSKISVKNSKDSDQSNEKEENCLTHQRDNYEVNDYKSGNKSEFDEKFARAQCKINNTK